MMENPISVHANVVADFDKVRTFYTEPDHIKNWNSATDDWYCPEAENDLRPGGKFRSAMAARDGSFHFDFEGIYDQVTDDFFSYTLLDGRKAEVRFTPQDGSIDVDLSFEAEKQNSREMQQQGWQAILNNFKKYTEGEQG